jgi:hypothetical protein
MVILIFLYRHLQEKEDYLSLIIRIIKGVHMSVSLYLDHKPTRYITLKESLNQNLLRLENLGYFHQYQIRKQVDNYFDPKTENKFWLFSENTMEDDPVRSKVVEILYRLYQDKQSQLHKDKILVCSVFRSVHDICLEFLSTVSGIPFVFLKNGIPEDGCSGLWNKIVKGVNAISELPIYFFEWSNELPTQEKVLEQFYLSRIDDRFRMIILTGISNLREFHKSDGNKFEENLQHIIRFAEEYKVGLLSVP